MKRPGITLRLFLAVLSTATLVAVAMGAATQINFTRGFLGYLDAQALRQMEAALPRLQQAWAARGRDGWAFVRGRPGVWYRLIEPVPDHEGGSPWDLAIEQLAPHMLGLGRRLTLLDARRQPVIGPPRPPPGARERPIVVDGETVGWVVLTPVQSVADDAALHFLASQRQASLAMGALAVLLSALIAWWVARALLAPVRDVARATHRLAAGDRGIRVTVQGHDEVAQLAQDFNQLALTLERNERMRRDHMADLSHELRTPLAVLRGELEAIEDGVHALTPDTLRLLQAEVGALAQLVDDLHQLAMADVGALTYDRAPLDLTALLQQAADGFAARCAEAGLSLGLDLPGHRVTLVADEGRLRQLLHNLLDNAVRYTDAGGALRLGLSVPPGSTEAAIDLHDSAPGVPEELLPRLFDRFFRVEPSRGRRHGGSGLGLAIGRRIVEAHGGRIEARPSPMGGLWIAVRLPLPRTDLT